MSFDIPRKLWEHPAPETTAMFKFKTNLERQTGLHFKDFEALHAYSIANRSDFWRFTFTQFPIVWHGHLPAHVVDESASVETNPKWFPGVKLNYAQNVLFSGDEAGRPTKRHKEDDRVALTEGILDRLLQIRPTYVFFDDWAVYNGKTIDLRPKIKETIAGLRAVPEFRSVIAQARFPGRPNDVSSSPEPLMPLHAGGCQHMSLGMDVQVFSPEGARMPDGEPGELVCVQAFPTMPVSFFGEGAAAKYRSSYFERFPGIWTHGDFIQVHPVTRQVNFLGRSDGVLNPSGVRFGSAEIYNVVNAHFADRVADSVCVGQRRPQDSDERVLLFLLMKEGHRFTKALAADIKQAIRKDLSPRHVPAYVFETPEIPTTVNMKKVELPVKQIVSGQKITPSGTLANPGAWPSITNSPTMRA
ncbi:unnamed protein product [Parascedosporium putredinis]|uniref:Acetyl-coenzyme A synthetase N-terminal domain-containing protein n=1 Tax=Parascedosporium putredinis TaxID=1442378 RepID=A0A9P1H1R3_9PEZI|nr:unnamed protein product [Parascedosporium putredinis]CAI7994032.1 unnamed protein product [Parascedosporium putredinis]